MCMQNLQVYSSYNNYEYHTKITILVKNQHFLLDSQDQKGIKHKKHRYFIYPRPLHYTQDWSTFIIIIDVIGNAVQLITLRQSLQKFLPKVELSKFKK